MIFSQENPLTSPRRLSGTPMAEPASSESTSNSNFSSYFEDAFKTKLNHDTPSMRNSFCSQGSNNSESTSSSFSSSLYISNYLNSFRNSPHQSNLHSNSSIAPEHFAITANPTVLTSEVTTNCGYGDNKESPRHRNDRILLENTHINSPEGVDFKSHFDYYFADDGLIAYLPDKLALILKEAIFLFNLKPNSSKDFLRARKVISNSASDFAKFIFTHSSGQSRLSKRRIGEFLGNSHPYNQDVLNCFLAKFDFTDMALDEAIRSLVRQFRLPGEAQQIDRILEKFANIYYSQNNESSAKMGASNTAIKSADVAYIISFSILMLNTDLHNPSVPLKNKMTVQEFIRNNRGINGGLDIPPEHLQGLYSRIKNDEIKMDMADMLESDVPAFMAPIMAGYLLKLYHVAMVPMWKKRWFILNDGCLYYFNKPYETKPKCIMPLENIRIEVQMSSVTVPSGDEARTISNSSLYEGGTESITERGDKGRVSFIENIGVESSSSTDCILIVYGAASSGLLKSSKLSKKGGMTLAPRSRLVLRASCVTERDEWLAALQVDTPSFDPLKNASTLTVGTDKWKATRGGDKVEPEKSSEVNTPKSRYDTDIYSSNSSNSTDQSHSVLSSYNRRHSQCSNHSELEGSVDSSRSYVSWNSDHSGTSGELSISSPIPSPIPFNKSNLPEPPRGAASSASVGGNGVKWANPFGTSFQKPKNVSWPNASPNTVEAPASNKKVVDISAVPDSTSGRIMPARIQSSSSILSFASVQSSTHSTHSAHSDETILFGMSEVLLEGSIYRYIVPAKLNSTNATSETGIDEGQNVRGSDDAVDPQPANAGSPIERAQMDDRAFPDLSPLTMLRKASHYSSPDFTSHHQPGNDGIASNIRNTHSMDYNTISTRHSLSSTLSRSKLESASIGGRRRNSSVSAISDPSSTSRYSDSLPNDILAALTAARAAVSALITPTGSGSSEASQSGILEVAIPASDYRSQSGIVELVNSKGGGTSDLTGDSSYSTEQDFLKDGISDGLATNRIPSRPASFSHEINLEEIVIDVDAISSSSTRRCTALSAAGAARLHESSIVESRGKQDDIPAAQSNAISPPVFNAPKDLGSRERSSLPSSTVDKNKTENDSDYDDTTNVRVKKVFPQRRKDAPLNSDACKGDDDSMDGSSPSFIFPKRLDRYSEEPKYTSRESEPLHRGRRSSTGSNISNTGTNCAKVNPVIPVLSFASIRGMKPLEVGDSRQNCPLGIDISMGSAIAHNQGQCPPLGSGSSSSPHPLGPKIFKHPSGPNGLRDAKKWKRMHLTLLSDTDGNGDVLFYFPSEEAAACLRTTGVQTQQGYLRMRCVQSVDISIDEKISSINIFTKNELLSFALVRPSDDIYRWVNVLRESAENSSGK